MPFEISFKAVAVLVALLIGIIWVIRPFLKRESHLIDNSEVRELTKLVSPSKILSPYERKLYLLLIKALPNHIVLCQVSFNAFIKCDDMATRNKFNRKMCDFMIVDYRFNPIVCVELDDKSHSSAVAKMQDAFRDNLMAAAFIHTVRFDSIPSSPMAVWEALAPAIQSYKQTESQIARQK